MNTQCEKLKEFIDEIRVIDTHEHQIEEGERLKRDLDFGVLMEFYVINPLIVAGLNIEDAQFVLKEGNDLSEKWQKIALFWDYVKNTDYCRAYLLSMDKIYGMPHLNANTYEVLSRRIQNKNQPGIVRYLIQDVAGVDRCIVNATEGGACFFREETDGELFYQEIGFGSLFSPDALPLKEMEEFTGITVYAFDDLLNTIDWYMEEYGDDAVAIKIQSAYFRTLYFEEPDKPSAAASFVKFLKDRKSCPFEDVKRFQDYMFHHIVRRAMDYDLPVRLHTGYLAGTNYMRLEDINPALLTNIFRKYPKTRFSLFHIGYPYVNELLAIAKHYSNVYVDLCWAWIIDSEATKQFLKQFILTTPVNKLFGFGGDFCYADLVYGHLEIARIEIAEALSGLMCEGILTEQDAQFIIKRILRENAIEFFKLHPHIH